MDLFAGCGGFSEGFRSLSAALRAGEQAFATVVAVEFDRAAAATFKANHADAEVMCLDIDKFDAYDFEGSVDVITGGPPCQGFSGLGKEWPHDPRNSLWEQYARIVSQVRPKAFVLENVDRFFKSYEYERLLEAVQPGGPLADYTLAGDILNSADYGVPQARRRAIVIGTHRSVGKSIALPAPTHAKEPPPTDGLSLFDAEPELLPWLPVDSVFDRSAALEICGTLLPERQGADNMAGPFHTRELHIGRNPTALSLARYRAIPAGGNRANLRGVEAEVEGRVVYLGTESWDRHRSGSGDVMGRLRLGQPSVTIRTEFYKPEKGRYLHPVEHRPITHYEAALIQSFPETYLWHGTKIEIARQIGNAVPVGLARSVASAIYSGLATGTSNGVGLGSPKRAADLEGDAWFRSP
ncbi:DNA cytosine methyltransferase [Streptomyces subrutilus]|uniref:DNA cytosine methyltransferase n=1 Tax=Streptomyces subrutilus TaxID=36818 RepID=UPI0034144F47